MIRIKLLTVDKIKQNRKEIMIVGSIILLSLIVRIIMGLWFKGESFDVYLNFNIARDWLANVRGKIFSEYMLFLPFTSAILTFIYNDLFVTSFFLTMFCGTLLLLFMYLVARKIYNQKVALLALILLVTNSEFLYISSSPLRFTIYASFIFMSLYFSLTKRYLPGALGVCLAFSTRMEGFFIGYPYYIISLLLAKMKKKGWVLFGAVSILAAFFIYVELYHKANFFQMFMRTLKEQHLEDQKMDMLNIQGGYSICARMVLALKKYGEYLLNIYGANLLFCLVGVYYLIRNNIKTKFRNSFFVIAFSGHFVFWYLYIFIHGRLQHDVSYRYLLPMMPFMMILISSGFFKLYLYKYKYHYLKIITPILLICFTASSYYIHYNTIGKFYRLMNIRTTHGWNASIWAEKKLIPLIDKKNKFLSDAVVQMALYRKKYYPNSVGWDELYYGYKYKNLSLTELFEIFDKKHFRFITRESFNYYEGLVFFEVLEYKEYSIGKKHLVPFRIYDKDALGATIIFYCYYNEELPQTEKICKKVFKFK